MDERAVTTIIDPEKCNGCGLCIKVCPSDTISLVNGIACITGDKSLSCGHCMAICPQSAIIVKGINPDSVRLNTIELDKTWTAPGRANPKEFAMLLASRRSCRNFKSKPVDEKILEDLVKLGMLAPSGTNSQKWTFTCLVNREQISKFGILIQNFYKKLNKTAENLILRKILNFIGRRELETYYQEYYESVKQAIIDMETHGQDRLFHGAQACIIVGSSPGASCPVEDAMLATGNILLASHTMGLGTCLIGFAIEAMKRDKSIQLQLGIPKNERMVSVIAMGHPDEKYQTIPGRKRATTRFIA